MAQSSENNYSSDDMVPRKKVKLEDDNPGPSSTAQEESMRPAVNKFKKLHVKLRKNDQGYQRFDTDGKETILEMVKRMIEIKAKREPNIHGLLFQSFSDHSFINIGLATGALSEKEWYICSFRKKRFSDIIRLYDVKDFDEGWNLSSFIVKFESNRHFLISDMQRIVDVVRVNFFPGESLFEALYRDGRFSHTDAIHKSDFKAEDEFIVSLDSEATSNTFTIIKRTTPNPMTVKLAESEIQPLRKPGDVVVKQEIADLQATFSNVKLSVDHVPPEVELEVEKLSKHSSIMKEYFEIKFRLKLEKEADPGRENNRKKRIDNVVGKTYREFALNYEHRVFVSDLEEVLTLKHSVGAVIAIKGNQETCFGTCFRVGEKYVITNCHVLKQLRENGFKLDHVNFSYQEDKGHCFNFDSTQPLLVYSDPDELDYAVLQLHLDSKTFLPLAVTELGYSIPNPEFHLPVKESLTLMGHPGEKRKQIDVSCPLRRNEIKEQEFMVLSLRRLSLQDLHSHEKRYVEAAHKTHSEPYDVSTFFEGSSGSPGLLMSNKMLVVLHCRGVYLPGAKQRYSVEEGILMSSIVKDVHRQKVQGLNSNLLNIDLHNIFGPLDFIP